MLAGKNIVLMVTGSIAAYKSAELVRELVKQDAKVNVVLSESAKEFVSPMTLQTLSENSVRSDMFDLTEESKIGHIELADNADVILVAPATADFIARAAQGRADDLPKTILLASKAPVVIAPAMNVNMWNNELTKQNVEKLKSVGMQFVAPGEGELACGWTGEGRLAELDDIVLGVKNALIEKDLDGSAVVVTAGATEEYLDPIRFISNRSTGKMGTAIAQAAMLRGADVTLISGPTSLAEPKGLEFHRVTSAKEMHDVTLNALFSRCFPPKIKKILVFMVAAVSDHRPEVNSPTKLKHSKSDNYSINMVPNPDILKELGQSRSEIEHKTGLPLTLVGFAAETGNEEQLLESVNTKLKTKNADIIVGNIAKDSFGKDTTRVWIVDKLGKQEEISTADKSFVADKIINAAVKF